MKQAAGNNIESTAVVGRPFPKGVSGNPSGRPKGTVGLATYIKHKTNDGEEIADFMLGVMRGDMFSNRAPKIAERIEAARWLADRAWGRPLQETDINVNMGKGRRLEGASDAALDLILNASDEQLQALLEAKADGVPTLAVEGDFKELDEARS